MSILCDVQKTLGVGTFKMLFWGGIQKDFLDVQKAFFGDVYSKFLPNGPEILGGLSPPFPNFRGAIAP